MARASDPSQFLLAEYGQLRGEILKRSELQHQLISIALVAFGGLAAVGLRDSPSALLAYPMLALFLAAAWSYNDIQIAQLGAYIRYRIEEQLIGGDLGWEHARLSDHASKQIGSLIKVATRGILWGSECLAIGLYLVKRLSMGWPPTIEESRAEVVLVILAGIAVVFTIVIMWNRDGLVDEIGKNMEKPVVSPPAE
jgi:uncharacterized membrane protein